MKEKKHAMYRNEVDEPHMPAQGHLEHGMGCNDFKKQAMPIAYGQAASEGMKSDEKKIAGQFKNYHWDSGSEY